MRALVIGLAFVSVLHAQPLLTIRNVASPMGAPGARIAPRSLVEITVRPSTSGDMPVTLDPSQPVTVTLQSAGEAESRAAEVLAVNWFSVIAATPADLALGPASLTLTFNGGQALSADIDVAPSAFGLFTIDGFFLSPALAQNVNPGAAVELNGLTKPARPGGYVTLWGTGLGVLPPEAVTVRLDGEPVPVAYAGPSPELPALDQINVFVPDSAAIGDGCYVPLVVETGGDQAVASTITMVRGEGPCAHPLGLSEEQMARLDAGGGTPVGSLGVSSLIGPPPSPEPGVLPEGVIRRDAADASFYMMDAAGIARWSRLPAPAPELGCRLEKRTGVIAAAIIRVTGFVGVGESMTLSGPGDRLLGLALDEHGFGGRYTYFPEPGEPVTDPADLPPSVFTAGEWIFTAPGSAEAESFQVPVKLPPVIELAGVEALQSIDRAADLTITWNPEGFGATDMVDIQLAGSSSETAGFETTTGAITAACRAPALDGRVVIPAGLLREFDPGGPDGLPRPSLSVWVSGPPREESSFSFRLTNGELVPGQVSYSFGEWLPVGIR